MEDKMNLKSRLLLDKSQLMLMNFLAAKKHLATMLECEAEIEKLVENIQSLSVDISKYTKTHEDDNEHLATPA